MRAAQQAEVQKLHQLQEEVALQAEQHKLHLTNHLRMNSASASSTPPSDAPEATPEDQLGLYVGGLRKLAASITGQKGVPPPAGWLVNHLLGRLGLSGHLTKVILLQGQAPVRDLADRSLVFFRTTAIKDMASLDIKEFAKTHNIRDLYAKDALPSSALHTAFRLNATGLALRRAQLVTSFRVINRSSRPILVLARPGRTNYEDAQEADFSMAATSSSPAFSSPSTAPTGASSNFYVYV